MFEENPVKATSKDVTRVQNALDYSQHTKRPSKKWRLVLLILFAAGILFSARLYLGRDRNVPSIPLTSAPVISTSAATSRAFDNKPDIVRTYREKIVPLLEDFEKRNQNAVIKAVDVFHERVNQHRTGIKTFCDDITGWGTRFGVIGHYTSDVWERRWNKKPNVDTVKEYINAKFRKHILSESAIQADLSAAVQRFNEDLQASRNRLYAEMYLPLKGIKVPAAASDESFKVFAAQLQSESAHMMKDVAPGTLVSMLAELVGGGVAMVAGEEISELIIVQIMTRLGTQLAIEGIEAGGATAAGTALGGGGGSIAGPAGTVIGLGVGFVAGAVVDWWLSNEFKAKVAEQCSGFLDNVDRGILRGNANAPGLEKAMVDVAKIAGENQRKAILKALMDGPE